MIKFTFRDWAGNNFVIEAIDRWDAFKKAKKQIVIKPFYIVDNIKIIQNGL